MNIKLQGVRKVRWRYSVRMLYYTFVLLAFLVGAPAHGLDFSVSTNGVSISQDLQLDRSTSFEGLTVLNHGNILHGHDAMGSGDNKLLETVKGHRYQIDNTIDSSGTFSSTASTAASADFAAYSQDTRAGGDAGYVGTDAISSNNEMHLGTYFDGSGGNLDVHLSTGAAEGGAIISGTANVNGIECYNDDISGILASGDLGRSVDGIYSATNGGVGTFGLNAVNLNAKTSGTTSGATSSPYLLTGYRWNTKNPKIQLYLNKANLPSSISDVGSVKSAIIASEGLWDASTSQALFASGIKDTTAQVSNKAPDYLNVHSFMPLSDARTIAYAQTWYSRSTVGGYYSALDSDVVYNTKFGWSFGGSGGSIDFQTIASHELGHTLGLLDLYTSNSASKTQMMYGYYTGQKRTLGSGDKAGIQKLYGA